MTAASISIPQFLLVVRTKQTHGLALTSWIISLGTNIGWLGHGIKLLQIDQIWPNAWALCATITVLYFLRRNGRYQNLAKLLPGLGLAVLLITVDNLVGSEAFGLVVIVPAVFSMMRQGIALMRAPKVEGVSAGMWALQVANQVLWLVWAIVVREPGTGISSAVCLGPAVFVLTWRLLRAHGVGPVGAAAVSEPEPIALAA